MSKLPASESSARIADVQSEFLKLEDPLSEHLRGRIVELITTLVDAQIDDVLSAEPECCWRSAGARSPKTRLIGATPWSSWA